LILVLISRPLARLYPIVMLCWDEGITIDAALPIHCAGITSYRFSCTRPAKP
jgi:D-arabinose 1-dehydrogenase-like Zn-dependent alcohol dehydrogenase